MQLTREEALEYKRCANSVVYTIEKYGYIKHIKRGKVKCRMYDWQRDMLQRLQDGQNLVVLKSRQVGVSWTMAMFTAWLLLFRPDVECLFLSQKEQKAIKLLGKVKFVMNNFPAFIRREYSSDSKTRLAVIHRMHGATVVSESSIDSLTTTGESGRGDTAWLVFLDEFAHLENAEETWTAIKPTTAHGGQIVAASSPNGTSGAFARLYMEADGGDSETFVPLRIHYTDCGFDEAWMREASDGMTQTQIEQEFELAFLGTGSPAFQPNDVKKCYVPMEDLVQQPELAALLAKPTKYAIGIDSAEIKRNKNVRLRDYNAAVVFNQYGIQIFAENNQMALDEWAGKTMDVGSSRVEMPGFVSQLHVKFPGLMICEENGAGLTVENRHILPNDSVSEFYVSRTTSKSKPRIVNQFALALAGGLVVITDKRLYYQLLIYEDLGQGKYSAPEGQHDDLVVAAMLAYEALIELGGYEFEMPPQAVGIQKSIVPPEYMEAFGEQHIAGPVFSEFQPGDGEYLDWNMFDPRRELVDEYHIARA